MRVAKVPIDMASEQKEIMGIVSKRQLIYLVVGVILLYTYVPFVYSVFSLFSWIVGAFAALFSAVPVLFAVAFFAFFKVGKYNMNRDYFYWIKLQRRTQYGSWRKGRDDE